MVRRLATAATLMINDNMKHIFSLILLLLAATTATAAESPARKPNVLMICIDDLNDWVGFLGGHPQAITPHMDSLARRGRIFANAHCAVPVCTCSRVSVMSGVAATTHGSYEIGPKYEQLPALAEVPTIQRYFKEQWLLHTVRRQSAAPRFRWKISRRHRPFARPQESTETEETDEPSRSLERCLGLGSVPCR